MRRCDGVDRREFLRLGSLGTLGLGLADVLRLRARAGGNEPGLKNCILVWLDGGPSHLETFDLKPDAPAEVRGPYRPIATKVPGLAIGEHFSRLARQTDKVCLIRSMTSELGEHNFGRHYLLTGYKPSPVLEYPSYGAVVARCRGPSPDGPRGRSAACCRRGRRDRRAGGRAGRSPTSRTRSPCRGIRRGRRGSARDPRHGRRAESP